MFFLSVLNCRKAHKPYHILPKIIPLTGLYNRTGLLCLLLSFIFAASLQSASADRPTSLSTRSDRETGINLIDPLESLSYSEQAALPAFDDQLPDEQGDLPSTSLTMVDDSNIAEQISLSEIEPFDRDHELAEYLYHYLNSGYPREKQPNNPTAKRLGIIRLEAEEFYAGNQYRPLWTDKNAVSQKGKDLLQLLSHADRDGLNPQDYILSEPEDNTAEKLAEFDFSLSLAIIRYAHDARGGRIEPARLSRMMTPELKRPTAMEILPLLSNSDDPVSILASFHPPHQGYKKLKQKLAEIRDNRHVSQPFIAEGPLLKTGDTDERVPQLYERLGKKPENPDSSLLYSKDLSDAVALFQRENGLKANGRLTPATVKLLNQPAQFRLEADIIANMERWRWLPDDLGSRHIFVDIPNYSLHFFEDGDIPYKTRIIVGKPASPTAIFSHKIQYLVVNPYWTIPPSIMKSQILPGMRKDPKYAEKRGYQVSRRGKTVSVRQPPGPRNSLGYIKFMFPNDHSIYLHDTPNRSLFGNASRAISHGCVRVEKPFTLAALIMKNEKGNWSEQSLRSLIGRGERHINLQNQVSVHLAYFTLSVDEGGELARAPDIYGFHARTLKALDL